MGMFEFGPAKLYFKPADGKDDNYTLVGECNAMILETESGRKMRFGDRAALFDMEQTEADRQLLEAMKIKT